MDIVVWLRSLGPVAKIVALDTLRLIPPMDPAELDLPLHIARAAAGPLC
jgi:hypothetical protein